MLTEAIGIRSNSVDIDEDNSILFEIDKNYDEEWKFMSPLYNLPVMVKDPDMTFSFEMNSADFHIPALTIQPIVENAIKHGLMKLEKGGTIRVVSYETDTHYCVTVEDDGVGFNTDLLLDERKHVGIRNIRGRLKAMVNGTLTINSTEGVGTTVLIEIPKEVE